MSLIGRDRPVLEVLSDPIRSDLLKRGHPREYRDGNSLMAEGDSTSYVVAIVAGRVVVSSVTEQGKRLILAIRRSGDLVGDLAAIDGGRRSASVTALGTTSAVVIPGERFRGFLTAHPDVAEVIMRSIGARLRDADAQRRALASASVVQRMAQLLIELAEHDGVAGPDGLVIESPLSQRQLGESIGVSRVSAAKALRMLRDGGAVRTGMSQLVVMDLELLRLLAHAPPDVTLDL